MIGENSQWFNKENDIVDIILKYFANLFSSSNPTGLEIETSIDYICPTVDNCMNNMLCAPYIENEICKSLFDMHPFKALGPDGFTTLFFQKNWTTVGKNVMSAFLKVLNDQGELNDWNTTIITLISKVSDPLSHNDFRPIIL